MKELLPELPDSGCVGRRGTGMDAGYILEDGLDALFASCFRGFGLNVKTSFLEGLLECGEIKVLDSNHGVFLFHCPKIF